MGWRVLNTYLEGRHDRLSVIYETADPGKFPDDVEKAIGVVPDTPPRIAQQSQMVERIYSIDEPPDLKEDGSKILSDTQYERAKKIIETIFG